MFESSGQFDRQDIHFVYAQFTIYNGRLSSSFTHCKLKTEHNMSIVNGLEKERWEIFAKTRYMTSY